MSEFVYALNEVSGQVSAIDAEWLDHPTFGPILREKRTEKPVINHVPADPVDPDAGSTGDPVKKEEVQ